MTIPSKAAARFGVEILTGPPRAPSRELMNRSETDDHTNENVLMLCSLCSFDCEFSYVWRNRWAIPRDTPPCCISSIRKFRRGNVALELYTLKNRNKERLDRFPTRLLLPTGWQHLRRRLRDIFDGQKTGMERKETRNKVEMDERDGL